MAARALPDSLSAVAAHDGLHLFHVPAPISRSSESSRCLAEVVENISVVAVRSLQSGQR